MTEPSNQENNVTIQTPSELDPHVDLQEPPPAYLSNSCQFTTAQEELEILPPCYHKRLRSGEECVDKGSGWQRLNGVLEPSTNGGQGEDFNGAGILVRQGLLYLTPIVVVVAVISICLCYGSFISGDETLRGAITPSLAYTSSYNVD